MEIRLTWPTGGHEAPVPLDSVWQGLYTVLIPGILRLRVLCVHAGPCYGPVTWSWWSGCKSEMTKTCNAVFESATVCFVGWTNICARTSPDQSLVGGGLVLPRAWCLGVLNSAGGSEIFLITGANGSKQAYLVSCIKVEGLICRNWCKGTLFCFLYLR